MSTWNIGMNDVTEEMQAMKDKLSSKEGRIAAQEAQISRQAAELDELRQNMNDTLHKLSREADRVIVLEQTVAQHTQELRNERLASQNINAALSAAHEKFKQQTAEYKQLEGTLQTVSYTSNGHNLRSTQLEQEKRALEARIRELESILQRQAQSLSSTPRQLPATRPRSSSLSRLQISSLERELKDTRVQLAQRDDELRSNKQRLSHLQNDLLKTENEKLFLEKRSATRIADLENLLAERAGEVQDLENDRLGNEREEELLRRIEEDDAKIAALEKLVGDTYSSGQLQDKLKRVERRLKEEAERVKQLNAERLKLQQEKEGASSDLRKTQEMLSERTVMLEELKKTWSESSAPQPQAAITEEAPDGASVQHVERLLTAVHRLRAERDSLRCDLQFLQTETAFTVQSLESKLAAAPSGNSLAGNVDELLRIKDARIGRISLVAAALAAVVSRQDHVLAEADQELYATRSRLSDELSAQATRLEEVLEEKNTLEVKLEVATQCLEATTSQRNDALGLLDTKESGWSESTKQITTAYQDACSNLNRLEREVDELTKALEATEGERDSAKLQVTNLTTELQAAREDLSAAENRYSTLQFHQLSAMSNNEATRALRDQIQELEHRVMRRTEQIGIHQHDIRRLETNLRLQEERLGEMTVELETLGAQKDAMVEDCADAREARDDALRRVERLEVELEIVEGKVQDQDVALTTLVEIVINSTSQARNALRRTRVMARLHERQCKDLKEHHLQAVQQLQDRPSLVEQLNQQLGARLEECNRFAVALAVCRSGYDSTRKLLQTTLANQDRLAEEVQQLHASINSATARSQTLSSEVERLRRQAQDHSSGHTVEMTTLERQLESLHNAMAEKEIELQAVITRATRAEESVQSLTREQELLARSRLDDEKQNLEAVGVLERRCREISNSLSELQAQYDALVAERDNETRRHAQSMGELEERLTTATTQSVEVNLLRQELDALRSDQSSQITQLQESLDSALQEIDIMKEARDAAYILREETLQKLAQVEASYGEAGKSAEVLRNELEDQVRELHSTIESQTRDLDRALADAQHRTHQLEQESDARIQDKEAHKEQLESLRLQSQETCSLVGKLQQELSDAQEESSAAQRAVQALKEERQTLQEEMTTLKAENQRSISFHRYLESQVRESETQVGALKEQIEQARADVLRSEAAAKTTEINISLQTAQHKREIADMRSELNTLRCRPNLEQAMAELEERNNEMEELLRKKCAEIEENDDKALEMLKNNKKLSNKVESLTRKVQNLQTKLNAAKAAQPVQPPIVPESGPSTLASPPSIPSPQPNPESVMITPVPPPLQRTVSMPSSLPRPKTPERRALATHVYRDPAPELMPTIDTSTTSSIGKKRRAPDDFEGCEGLPPQAFTADSVPRDKMDQATPRVRRAFSNAHSGFTPVRRRPPAPVPSPQRASSSQTGASPYIMDVTNSPRRSPYSSSNPSAKASKRSWLGKIRGASAHPILQPSSRSKLERDS